MPGPGTREVATALAALRSVRPRREVGLEAVPAPSRLAPFAHALAAAVTAPVGMAVGVGVGGAAPSPGDGREGHDELATGRFVLLHDPASPSVWGGPWRVVTYSRARLDPSMGSDPLLGEVGWAWLQESLAGRGAGAAALSGTVTRVVDERFGELGGVDATVDLEIRASWSPTGDADTAGRHLQAWVDLLAALAGLPPVPDGVTTLTPRV